MKINSTTGLAGVLLAWAGVTVALLMLSGCPSNHPRAPQSIEESIYIAAVYNQSLAESVNNAYSIGAIAKSEQLQALDLLQEANTGIQIALDSYRAGNYQLAEDRLGQVEAALRMAALIVARMGERR